MLMTTNTKNSKAHAQNGLVGLGKAYKMYAQR